MDESMDEVTSLAVRALPADREDPDDPLAEAPTALDGPHDDVDIDGDDVPAPAAPRSPPFALPPPREAVVRAATSIGRNATARPTVPPDMTPMPGGLALDLGATPGPAEVAARRWRMAFSALAVAVVTAAAVLGAGDRITGRIDGEPMTTVVAGVSEAQTLAEAEVTPEASDPMPAPATAPVAEFSPAALPAATVGSPLAVDPTPWQAVRRRWLTCVERNPCGKACRGRFSILIDDGGVAYSVESSAGDVPDAVSSCLIGVTRRSKDLRRLLAKLGVSELTWSPTRTAVGEASSAAAPTEPTPTLEP
jgi:hypothetical protein